MSSIVQPRAKPSLSDTFQFSAVLFITLILLSLPIDAVAQAVVALVLIVILRSVAELAQHHGKYRDLCRVFAIVVGLALTFRYLLWRSMYTLTASDWLSLTAVWVLFIAEIYAATTHLMGCFVNTRLLHRPLLDLASFAEHELPSVDVFIPTYNEDEAILEVTVRAALLMKYPANKVLIHLLDDGGTDQKVSSADPLQASLALKRRESLQALCARLGVQYRTRARNEHAKAGNLNSAFAHTSGELIVVLDADHVPTSDFLERTVPWMLKDNKTFLVQTPHFMANPDPVERNFFAAFSRMPSENDMFYGTIQKGLDYWGSSFFCGSAALMRREHLALVGGIAGESITEDAETALNLHKLGFNSVYVDKPMVSGLAPETFNGFITQRMRWAQGMAQILLLKKPYMDAGLKWYQRIGYMSSIFFWLFPFARIIFLVMPLAYLVFGLEVYHASLSEIIAFTLPHVVATYMISTLLFGKTRWPLVSEIYEMLQCVFTLRALLKVFWSPRAPSFVVTPKGENLSESYISPLSTAFYWLLMLTMLGMFSGIHKLWVSELTRELTAVVLLWNGLNLVLLLGILSVLIERKQVRSVPRLPAFDKVSLIFDSGSIVDGQLQNLSIGGASIHCAAPLSEPLPEQFKLRTYSRVLNAYISIDCKSVNISKTERTIRVKFLPKDAQAYDALIAWVLADSERWHAFQRRRTRNIGYWFGIRQVLRVSFRPVFWHLWFIISKQIQKFTIKREPR